MKMITSTLLMTFSLSFAVSAVAKEESGPESLDRNIEVARKGRIHQQILVNTLQAQALSLYGKPGLEADFKKVQAQLLEEKRILDNMDAISENLAKLKKENEKVKNAGQTR